MPDLICSSSSDNSEEINTPLPLRILIVDDNPDARESLRDLLDIIGYHTACFPDALSALAALEEFSPDVCISDIKMPIMDGHAFAREVRSNPQFSTVKLIAVSAYNSSTDMAKSLQAGFDQHFSKTLEPRYLLRILEIYSSFSRDR